MGLDPLGLFCGSAVTLVRGTPLATPSSASRTWDEAVLAALLYCLRDRQHIGGAGASARRFRLPTAADHPKSPKGIKHSGDPRVPSHTRGVLRSERNVYARCVTNEMSHESSEPAKHNVNFVRIGCAGFRGRTLPHLRGPHRQRDGGATLAWRLAQLISKAGLGPCMVVRVYREDYRGKEIIRSISGRAAEKHEGNRGTNRAKRRFQHGLHHVGAAPERGYVRSSLGDATPQRGGRAKRYFRATSIGLRTVRETKRNLIRLWRGLRELGGGLA